MDPEQVADEIGDFIVEKTLTFRRTGGILGLSGGVDSTVTTALTKRAFDKYNSMSFEQRLQNYGSISTDQDLELVAYLLPSNTNSPTDTEDGLKVAERLDIRYEVRSIENVVKAYKTTNPEALEQNQEYHKGNLMSEIRATILHVKAATEKKILLGTGNRDEDFGIGYYTLFGDGAVHCSPIGNLPKRLVREMARYLGFKDLADRIPTAGLEPGQTDFKDLGYSYDLVELVTEGYRQDFTPEELINHSQVTELVERDLRDYEDLFGFKKFQTVRQVIHDITKRHNIAYHKAELISPPVAEITLRYGT